MVDNYVSTSYNMAARALADLSHKGAKHPSAINQLSALTCYDSNSSDYHLNSFAVE